MILAAALWLSTVSALAPIWPMPSDISVGTKSLNIDGSFAFKQLSQSTLVDKAISRYSSLINVLPTANGGITSCSVQSESIDENLEPGVDESYALTVTSDGICTITSKTIWGSLYGMETFTQLLKRNTATDNSISCDYLPVVINDTPRFTHRGLMIDTSRHYLSLDTIRGLIDNLPTSKFNVLHWHTVSYVVYISPCLLP